MKKQLPAKTTISPQSQSAIATFIINLKKRPERRKHIEQQFEGKNEFKLTIVDAIENDFGAIGLWRSIQSIISQLKDDDCEYIIIGEDDLEFTKDYSKEKLMMSIYDADKNCADALLGGVNWFEDVVNIKERLHWVNNFSGLHFTIIFKRFFSVIIANDLTEREPADLHLGRLSDKIMIVHPFLAIQKDFGYSDVTLRNNIIGEIDTLFASTDQRLKVLNMMDSYYKELQSSHSETTDHYEDLTITTYVINLPERTERLSHIKKQFEGRAEFDVKIIDACKHEIGQVGLWLSTRKIIELAQKTDDDLIIICEDDHQFTQHYSKDFLIKNIIAGYQEGADFISGGSAKFHDAIPITENRFYVDYCLSAQFLVIFRHFFQKILDHKFDDTIVNDLVYSKLAYYKMLLYPFISTQKDFGYSDVTVAHSNEQGLITKLFTESDSHLNQLQEKYIFYKSKQG